MKTFIVNVLLVFVCADSQAFYVDERITFNVKSQDNEVANAFRKHPWIGLIEYRNDDNEEDEVTLGCSATLISPRHALVAAHCVTGDLIDRIGTPETVRFGEYDLSTDGRDCELVSDYMECTDDPVSIAIATIVTHPEYEPGVAMPNDIAVLHLAEAVTKSDFVSPVALPESDVTLSLEDGSFGFVAAGWGTVVTGRSTDKKNITEKSYVEFERCRRYFDALLSDPLEWSREDRQLCAGGEDSSFCQEDSGGALVRKVLNSYVVDGISSFGLVPCTIRAPVVYTKVHPFVEWIRNEMVAVY